ncbi:MAG: MBL fold metallo-hydrolase [Syntrophorhabdales bacterium]|jgi:glyoxylase-like metal-dependent hydrolase (beta-lactamase superfamily II)
MKTWTTKSRYAIAQVLGGRSNAFLLRHGGRNVLVDTGRQKDRADLQHRLQDLRVDLLDYLVLTHTHFDHTENAAFLQKKYGAKVLVHESEAGFLQAGLSQLPAGTLLPTKLLAALFAHRMASGLTYEPCCPDVLVEEGLDLTDFGPSARLIHTPGHSRGSISLIVDDEIALVGDAMFGVFPCTIFPPFADDVPQLISSWGRLLETGCRLFLPGHGSADNRRLVEKAYTRRRR